ncbi:hypothetical protein B0T12DRAFT_391294 [Alternaria alternata]|nr:hypothetical protein B0T12DRAFT_391294 [Alternaria alternata]
MQEQQSTFTIVTFINLHDAKHNMCPFATASSRCSVSSLTGATLPEPRKSHLRIGVTTPSNRLGRSSNHAARQALLTRLVVYTTPPNFPVKRRTTSSSAILSTSLARTRANDAHLNATNAPTCTFHGTSIANITRTMTVIVSEVAAAALLSSCRDRPSSWHGLYTQSTAS